MPCGSACFSTLCLISRHFGGEKNGSNAWHTRDTDNVDDNIDNGIVLRQIIEEAGLTQRAALALFNEGQFRPLSIHHWKAYLGSPGSKRTYKCPSAVVERMRTVIAGSC